MCCWPQKPQEGPKYILIMSFTAHFLLRPHCLFFVCFTHFKKWLTSDTNLNKPLSWNVQHAERSITAVSLLPKMKRTCFAATVTLLIVVLRLLESASWGSWFFVDTAANCCRGPSWQFVSQLFRTLADYDTSPLVLPEWKLLPEYLLNLWPSCFSTACSSCCPVFWSNECSFMRIVISIEREIKTTWI